MKNNYKKAFNSIASIFLMITLCTLVAYGQGTPSNVLPDLQYFKLTFPIDDNGDDYEGVDYDDREDPDIDAYERTDLNNWSPSSPYSQYFYVSGSEVVFRAHCAGALTSANSYPRCELREIVNGGDDLWEYDDEHELNAKFRVTHLPEEKQEVCMLQIKGNDSNSTSGTDEAFRLEYRQDGNQGVHVTINENTTLEDIMDYSVGQTIDATMYVNSGQITISLNNLDVSGSNGEWNHSYASDYSHGYFKAGAYTQSSIWSEKNNVADEDPDAYGEVRFSELTLGSSGGPPPPPPPPGCTATTPSNRNVSDVGTSSATVSWNSVSEIDHYNVRYKKTQDSNWQYKYSLSSTSTNLTGLNNNQEYEWQVRAKCSDGSGSSYSSGAGPDFTTGSSGGNTFTPDPNKIYHINCPVWNKRIAATGNSESAYSTSTSTTGADVEWKFTAKGDYWHIDRADGGSKPRLRTDNTSNADMQEIDYDGTYTYYEFTEGSSSGTYFLTLKDGPSSYKRLQMDSSGGIKMVSTGSAGSWESFTITEAEVNTSGGNNIVMIKKRNATGFSVDGKGGGSNGQNVHLWGTNSGNANQKWEEIPVGNGYYMYKKFNTNYCLDGKGGGSNGQNVHLWTCNSNNHNQHWLKQSTDGGAYKLIKRSGGGAYALNGGSGGKNGQNVSIWDASNGSYNLQWYIDVIGSAKMDAGDLIGLNATLYPNPATDHLNIDLTGAMDKELIISIYSIQGAELERIVLEESHDGILQLDVSAYSNGMYNITIQSNGYRMINKRLSINR